MRKGWILITVGVALLVLAAYLLVATLGGTSSNWAYRMTGLRALQDQDLDGTGVRVAIIDTGFDATHPSLDHVPLVAGGWKDYVNGKSTPYDDAGHGSHVAGVLAGQGSTLTWRLQGVELSGAAPGVSLIAVKAISAKGSGSSADVADGISFSVERGADIICLSLGSAPGLINLGTSDIEQAINDATNRGVLVVAAAGNTGEDANRNDVESPANLERVIAVGAVDEDKRVASFSARGNSDANYGFEGPTGRLPQTATRSAPHQKPEIVAPGVGIISSWKNHEFRGAEGTSQAVPFVCGALALLLQAKPSLKADNTVGLINRVKQALMASAEPVPGQQTPHDPKAGYGLLRADLLLRRFA